MAAFIYGELAPWPTKKQMARILASAGLRLQTGQYAIRVEDCSHFVFENYGGDLGEPTIDADAESIDQAVVECKLVSDALALAGIRHRFEIYNDRREMVGYLHHNWPLPAD